MTNAIEEAPWNPDTRRTLATAIGGVRPRQAADAAPQQRRPFTSLGSSHFDLDVTRSTSPRATTLQPVRTASSQRQADAHPTSTAPSEFDVRKFLLDQKKGNEPLHTTALFRSTFEAEGGHTTALGSSSKKKLPRMDHAKAVRQQPNQVGATASPAQALEATVTHFYTIEKLSESCFHAVQSKHNKTWQFLPGAEERSKSCSGVSANASSGGANSLTNVERPSRRVDVLDLDKCFEIAMQFVQKTTRSEIGPSTDAQLATIERDVLTLQAKVAHRHAACSQRSKDAAGVSTEADEVGATDSQKSLARTLFEQKWSDVVLGEIEAMLTKSFLEQGALLRKTRERYAKSFFKLERLYSQSTNELSTAREELQQTRDELRLVSAAHALDTQQMKHHYEDEIKRVTIGFENKKEDMERKLVEAKEQMTKMGDTMKTLNTIFRQMREDTDKVKAVELRENFNKLEKKYETCKEELDRLRPLVLLNQHLHDQKDSMVIENRVLKEKIANFDPIIASKDEIIATLMEQQSELIAAQELQAAQEDERRRLEEVKAAEDEEDEEDENNRDDGSGEYQSRRPPSQNRNRGLVSAAAVCVRCKENLKTMSHDGGLVTAAGLATRGGQGDGEDAMSGLLDPRPKRVQCMYFRILLPNLRGRRPQRELAWTLSCMRSIVFAKQLDDAMCKTSGGAFPLRIRMPEFVYSWFSPWRSLRDEKAMQSMEAVLEEVDPIHETPSRTAADNEASNERSEEQRQLQADEDRWCLYYGVKALVNEGYLEAKLFLSLLDEKYGEDEQVFMLYCYRVLDVLLGGKVNWGPFRDHVSYDQFSAQYEKEYGIQRSSSDLFTPSQSAGRVPKIIWISPYHASLATGIVLCKATEVERAALDKKLIAFAVTNLSEADRPTVYLTPTNTNLVRDSDTVKPRDPKSGKAAAAPPLQFVDANLWIELMMMEYKEEQAHRRAAIRLMFQTATTVSSSLVVGSAGSRPSISATPALTMDMEQFRIMMRTLNDDIPSFMIATLFRGAFMRGHGSVTFDSFLKAAEYAQFFSSCMRLENPVVSMARLAADRGHTDPHGPSHAALSTSARAASVVNKYFTLMHTQLVAMTAELPIWTRSLVDALMYELSSTLMDDHGSRASGGVLAADGVHLLAVFHRLLAALLLSKLAKNDATGCVLSSKRIFSIEKAIQAVLECVRVGDKTTVEQLMEAIRENSSVKRMQSLFRKHLQHAVGVPLIMRPLFHPSYSSQRGPLSGRQAERSLQWVVFVISDVLRRSLRVHSIQSLLTELSSVSSVLLQCGRGARMSVARDSNGGIGASPKPLLLELLYDSFVERFGTRCDAEKLLHDVFVSCRAMLQANQQLVVLFSYLCGMSDASPADRLMCQNEALAFVHAILRCGLHTFHITHPPPAAVGALPDEDAGQTKQDDVISQAAAEAVLFAAFPKLEPDQKQQLKMRLDEQLTIWKAAGLASIPTAMLGGSFALRSAVDTTPKQCMTADAFLVLALQEWKQYIQQRMNDLRVVCCSMEDEIAPFGSSLPLDTIATMLQKANVSCNNDELCAVFRRVGLTEQRELQGTPAPTNSTERSASSSLTTNKLQSELATSAEQLRSVDHMSDRLAAACFPLIARETLIELRRLEHALPTPFKVQAAVDDKAKFLVESWRAYEVPCRLLLSELRRVGKNRDYQAETVSRRLHMNGSDPGVDLGSSSCATSMLSQDVAHLETIHAQFPERLKEMNGELNKPDKQSHVSPSRLLSVKRINDRASSSHMSVSGSGASLLLSDETKEAATNARVLLVNEAWKMFRQLLMTFSRLRTVAGLGDGPLPDKWDALPPFASAPASA